ncbi:TPA: hypothetical protein NKO89_004770 [Vibrio parahaemolyticus]|nr:hypothetical protein [Vibrio parahaemolyticus]HCH0720660.1 hypothetical protein [Vibrio parahaemolyticus]HCM1322188.1 hypothetical protein [Vibrio parahaemolyticus]
MIKVLKWLIGAVTFPLWFPLVLMLKHMDAIGDVFTSLGEFASIIHQFWKCGVIMIHAIGWFFTIFILGVSIYCLVVSFLIEFELLSSIPVTFSKLSRILQNPVAWAAATSIVGATIAIGHVWNLELNRQKFREEKWERIRSRNNT